MKKPPVTRLKKLRRMFLALFLLSILLCAAFVGLSYYQTYASQRKPHSSAPQATAPQTPTVPTTKVYVAPDGTELTVDFPGGLTPEMEQEFISAAREGSWVKNPDGSFTFSRDDGLTHTSITIRGDISEDINQTRNLIVSAMSSGVTK